MSDPQPELVQMRRRYRYRNGEPARVLCVDGPTSWAPVVSINMETGGLFRHLPNGGYDEDRITLRDLLPLPESEQPQGLREWDVCLLIDGTMMTHEPAPGTVLAACVEERFRVREVREGGGK